MLFSAPTSTYLFDVIHGPDKQNTENMYQAIKYETKKCFTPHYDNNKSHFVCGLALVLLVDLRALVHSLQQLINE